MNYILKLFKRAEEVYLRRRILSLRPDLAKLPFKTILSIYREDAVYEFAKACQAYSNQEIEAKPTLSRLVNRAYAYDADQSIGYYRAHQEAMNRRIELLEEENIELTLGKADTLYDNIGLRRFAKEMLDVATNAVGPLVREN